MKTIPELESGFQAAVIDLAQLRGWLVHHARPARTNDGWRTPISGNAGFPDLVLARSGRLVVAELKSARGVVSSFQQSWLDCLGAVSRASAGVAEVHVWRPADWDEIERTLR